MTKAIKKDRSKLFSALAGILLLIFAAIEAIKAVADFFAPMIIAKLSGAYYYFSFDPTTVISIVKNCAAPLCFIVFAVLAAILLFARRNSVAPMIPMGMLTFVFFGQALNLVLGTVINTLLSRLMGVGIYSLVSLAISMGCLLVSLICALILTVVFCVAACTFMKKRRFILMIILTAVFFIGGLIGTGFSGISVVVTFVNLIFTNLPTQYIISSFYNSLISPIVVILLRIGLFIPVGLAALSYIAPRNTADKDSDISETVEAENE